MLFAAVSLDKPGSLELRMSTRPAHVAWLEGLGGALKLAGPFLGADGQPLGSLVIVEAADQAAAEAIFAADPYVAAGLFASASVRPWRHVFGTLG